MQPNLFGAKLMDWYARHKRVLPWRGKKDPYVIWLSEIILQQTRVEQGLPYFNEFLLLFPDIYSLANASEDQVLKSWEGLGYYSRARNLHKAAQMVVNQYDGSFPSDSKGLLSLPGVGPYTAAAIASICYNERVPVIDGNVNRFMSRMIGLGIPVDTALGRKTIHDELLTTIASVESPGDFNQALMEFGARHCVPKSPDCDLCVFNTNCQALKLDLVDELPIKKTKTAVLNRYFDYHILLYEGKTFVRQRKEKGIWQGLYEFILEESVAIQNGSRSVVNGESIVPMIEEHYTHILSHQRIHARFLVYFVSSKEGLAGFKEVLLGDLEELAMARITTRFLEENGARIQAIAKG